jgi:hypothetical protein
MMRKLGALAIVALFAGCSTIDVRGFVRDEDTGEPLSGATVRVGDDEVKSDSGGFYEIGVDDDDDYRHRVYVTKEGYEAATESLDVDDDDEEIHKDLRLKKAE